ncbi:MAG: MFS transporter [Candidatus Saganbacteria bacterium]|nr:MFS transporter [Candidatus Saganbacteria bacterium]
MEKRKYFWLVFNAAFILFIVKIDAFIVNVSLPTIARSFGLNLAEVSSIVVVYLLLLTNTMLIFGKLEDRLGVKKLLFLGYLLFTAGSLFCGLSFNLSLLIFARAVQGIGGAMLMICGFGAVNKFLPDEIKGWGMGIVTTAAALGIATGAPLGGFITYFVSWRWIFFVNVPLGILGLIISSRTSPEEKILREVSQERFDYVGAVLSFLGISGITYVLSTGTILGWTSLPILAISAASFLIMAIFIFWENKCQYPLMALGIFRNAGFVCANVAVFLIFMILSGTDFIIPFYLELAKGLNAYQVGIFLFLYSVAYSVCAPFIGKILDNPKLRFLSQVATVACAALFFVYAWGMSMAGFVITFLFFVFWGIANAFLIPENFRLVFTHTPKNQKGVSAGIFNVAQNLSAVFGICAFQIIFSHITHGASVPDPSSLFLAFSSIFVFGGILYLLTLFFSSLAERNKVLNDRS